jgi:hypothetical protein
MQKICQEFGGSLSKPVGYFLCMTHFQEAEMNSKERRRSFKICKITSRKVYGAERSLPFFSKGRGREGFSRIDIRLGINTVFIKSPLCSPFLRSAYRLFLLYNSLYSLLTARSGKRGRKRMPSAIYYFSRAFVRQSFNNFVKFRENPSETKDEVCVKVILFQKK